MKTIVEYRLSEQSLIKSDKYRFGDLYGFSWLPDFKIKLDTNSKIKSVKSVLLNKVDLYAVCDSYLWKFVDSSNAFNGVNQYTYVRWNDWKMKASFIIDTTHVNVLLIETDERKLRMLMQEQVVYDKLKVSKEDYSKKMEFDTESRSIVSSSFNEKIESNLEFNLFSYPVFTPIKEWKAKLNQRAFNRIDKEVTVSNNGDYLFIAQSTDSTLQSSSFNFVSNNEVERIVTSMNQISEYYKSAGFDEVYFSFIPNPVSIIENGRADLNHTIERIQYNPNRRAKTIFINDIFIDSPNQLFYKSDTHWNYTGYTLWLNEMNAALYSFCTDTTTKSYLKFK